MWLRLWLSCFVRMHRLHLRIITILSLSELSARSKSYYNTDTISSESWLTDAIKVSMGIYASCILVAIMANVALRLLNDFSPRCKVFGTEKSAYFFYKTVKKKLSEQSLFKKNCGSGGRPKIFLKSHNFAHTCGIEKRFSVFCSSSDALSEDIRFHSKS